MTPEQVSSTAVQWVAVAGTVATAVFTAAALLLPKIAALKAQVDTLFKLHEQNAGEIANNARAIAPATTTQITLTPTTPETPNP